MTIMAVVELTQPQWQAVCSILVRYLSLMNAPGSELPEEFIDVATNTTTTPGELLALVVDAKWSAG